MTNDTIQMRNSSQTSKRGGHVTKLLATLQNSKCENWVDFRKYLFKKKHLQHNQLSKLYRYLYSDLNTSGK